MALRGQQGELLSPTAPQLQTRLEETRPCKAVKDAASAPTRQQEKGRYPPPPATALPNSTLSSIKEPSFPLFLVLSYGFVKLARPKLQFSATPG